MKRKISGKKLVIYITAGLPDERACAATARAAIAAGADAIELGVPFSDPTADGKTIQRASRKALEKGVTVAKTFKIARAIAGAGADVYLMSYLNPLMAFGVRRLAAAAKTSSVAGFIIPDLTPESAAALRARGVALPRNIVYLAAPNTPRARLKKIAASSRGFVYAVALLGVTGARKGEKKLPSKEFTRSLRRMSRGTPVFAGFGVSSPSDAVALARRADGVIIGSAIMDIMEKVPAKRAPAAVGAFVAECKKAMAHEDKMIPQRF